MFGRTQIREGMTVRSSDGEKLGKVFAVGEDSFHVEKGLFFPKDYLCRFSDVTDVRDGELILASGRDALRDTQANADTSFGMGRGSEASTLEGLDTGRSARSGAQRMGSDSEVAIPVAREELDVVKREREAGEVVVTKEVVEEERTVQVPVRKERVRVERRSTGERPAMSASSFKDETITVPLRSEEVEVSKRAVVNEEVVIHKDAVEEQRRVAETVRREEVDVRTDGEVEDASRTGYRAPDDDPLKRY